MTLITRISITDCKARLAAAIDSGWWAFIWGHREILGTIVDDSFWLRVRLCGSKSPSPIFYGRFVASNNLTMIQGNFRNYLPENVEKACKVICFSIMSLFVLVALFAVGITIKHTAETLLAMVGLAALCLALEKFDKWSRRGKQRKIVAFLKDKLEASYAASEPAVSTGTDVPPVLNG